MAGGGVYKHRLLHGDGFVFARVHDCLLYTSDAADERSSVDLGGRRIIKKKTNGRIKRGVVIGEYKDSRDRLTCSSAWSK